MPDPLAPLRESENHGGSNDDTVSLKQNPMHFKIYWMVASPCLSTFLPWDNFSDFLDPFVQSIVSLKTHFSAYMRRVAFIITSNEHTLSLFLSSKEFLYLSDYECHKTPMLQPLPV